MSLLAFFATILTLLLVAGVCVLVGVAIGYDAGYHDALADE